ncbi:hypothetical protein AAIB41_14650 [Brucella sp. BE17]|uniref:hypothetical protein n=1 Tax=Brucella sp. BE17 TaxID=3142977 RepID=UPI0031BB031F
MKRQEEERLPLLAYAPAYPGKAVRPVPLETASADDAHNDITERMHAVRDALQSQLEMQPPFPGTTTNTSETAVETTQDMPESRAVSLWRRIFGAGLSTPSHSELESDEHFNTYSDTGLAAVIRRANERWEAENSSRKPS